MEKVLFFLLEQESSLKDAIERGNSKGRPFWLGDLDKISPHIEYLQIVNSYLIGQESKEENL